MPTSGSKGWRTQTTKQMGEALVVAELAGQGYLATSFSGNVPDFDLVAIREDLSAVPLQVKAHRGDGSWQGSVTRHLRIRQAGQRQIIEGLQRLDHPHLLWVYVHVPVQGVPAYFILSGREVQRIVRRRYASHLRKHGGKRPRRHDSMHFGLTLEDLAPHRGAWDRIARWRAER